MMASALMMAGVVSAAVVQTQGEQVTIRPDGGQAKVIRLEVINDNIIRVRATSEEALPLKPASLMIVPQTAPAKNSYTVSEEGETVVVMAKNVKAVVSKATGEVTFFDAEGNQLLKEAKEGKLFKAFTVPERELGIKTGFTVPEEAKHGLTWQMKFDSPEDEAFYGRTRTSSSITRKCRCLLFSPTRTMVCCGTATAIAVLVILTTICS